MAGKQIKMAIKIIIIVLGSSLSMVSVISSISVGQLFGTADNVRIGYDQKVFNYPTGQLDIPITINNTGWYDINGMGVRYNVSLYDNQSNFLESLKVNGTSTVGSFPGQKAKNGTLNLAFAPSLTPIDYLVDTNHRLYIEMEIFGKYALDLMDFGIYFNQTLPLGTGGI